MSDDKARCSFQIFRKEENKVKKKVLLILLTVTLAMSLSLLGCTTPAEEEEEEEEELGEITIAYPGGMGFGAPLASVDPCSFFYGGPPIPNIFEPLIGMDVNRNLVPLLAESWSWSEDGLILTVNLRDDVVFSSGDPFTSADVIFSFERHLQYNMPFIAQHSPDQGFDHWEADGDYTVKFYFTKTNVQYVPQTLVNNGITSKAYYDSVGEDSYVDGPVGTGPYKIVDWEEGQWIEVEYNDKYRGDKPEVESARLVVYGTPMTGVAMLQAGEVDIVQNVPGASINALEDAGYNRVDNVQYHALAIQFNMLADGDQPWDHLEVRQAINYAINKEALETSMICGAVQEGTWVLPEAPWYDPSLDPSYAYDLDTAKDLMAAAGYADGFDLDMGYLVSETTSPLAEYVSNALSALNIRVKLIAYPDMPFIMPAIAALHNAYAANEAVPESPGAFCSSQGWPGNPECTISLTNGFYWGKDNTLFYDEDITALVDQALTTLDDEDRWDIAKEAWAAIDELLPQIPIAQEVHTSFLQPNISYTESVSGLYAGPTQLVDLSIS